MMSAAQNLTTLVADDLRMLRRNWGWFVALGAVSVALGVVGLVFVGLLTLVSVVFIGWLFLIGGVLEVVHAIARKGWSGFWLDLVSGLLTAAVGVLIVLRPGEAAAVLTILIGVLFLVAGVFRLAAGLVGRTPYGGWLVLHGVVDVLLGGLILSGWPVSAVWVIGTLVAIDLIVNGIRLISLGLTAHRLPEPGLSPGTPAAA
jgi:uncharacterized membrane protein HdeD (DUF308 family)